MNNSTDTSPFGLHGSPFHEMTTSGSTRRDSNTSPLTHSAKKCPATSCFLPLHWPLCSQRARHRCRSLVPTHISKPSPPFPRTASIPTHGDPTDMKSEQVLTLLTTSPVRVYFGHGSSLTSACYLTRLDQYPPMKGENESAPFEGLVALVLAHSYPLCREKKITERNRVGKEEEKRNMSYKWTCTPKRSLQQQMEIACSIPTERPDLTTRQTLSSGETAVKAESDQHLVDFGLFVRNACIQSERQ